MLRCKTRRKVKIRGSHIATPVNSYGQYMIANIVDLKTHGKMDLCVFNDTDHNLHIGKGTQLAQVSPASPNVEMLLVDSDDIDTIHDQLAENNTCFAARVKSKSKQPLKKTSFSRKLVEDESVTDEEIIRANLKFDKDCLTKEEKEKLLKLVIKHKQAFSLRGEVGSSKSMTYQIRLRPEAEHFFRQPYRASPLERDLMRQEIEKLIKLGLIEKSPQNYVPFCSASLLVAKGDKSARLVVDYRLLNKLVTLFPPKLFVFASLSFCLLVCE